MLAKRIIPCLDVDDGRVKKGIKTREENVGYFRGIKATSLANPSPSAPGAGGTSPLPPVPPRVRPQLEKTRKGSN